MHPDPFDSQCSSFCISLVVITATSRHRSSHHRETHDAIKSANNTAKTVTVVELFATHVSVSLSVSVRVSSVRVEIECSSKHWAIYEPLRDQMGRSELSERFSRSKALMQFHAICNSLSRDVPCLWFQFLIYWELMFTIYLLLLFGQYL